MADSAIEWTDATWNPTTGCDRVSPGCANCYAVPQAKRNQAMAIARGVTDPGAPYMRDGDPRTSGPGFGLMVHESRLFLPLHWTKPKRIFVNSMSDLFHPEVPDGFIARVWDVMGRAPWHTFQVLTKRPERMRDWASRWADTTGDGGVEIFGPGTRERGPAATRARYVSGRAHLFAAMLEDMGEPPEGSAYPTYDWMEGQRFWPRTLPNVWLGTSVENARWRSRIDELRATPAAVRFLSCEPLLGSLTRHATDIDPVFGDTLPITLDLTGIDWVIVGGESGPGARKMHELWVRDIVAACRDQGVAPFVKQMGRIWSQENLGKAGHGGDIDTWPGDLRIREFPGGAPT